MIMYCTKCGKENNSTSLFCTSCGTKLANEIKNANPGKQIFAQVVKKPLLLAIAGVAITIVAYAAISPSPAPVTSSNGIKKAPAINIMPLKNPNKGDLYFCTRWIVVGVGRMNSVTDFFYMLPDNKIYHKIPAEGLDAFDLKKAQTNEPADTGTYIISDGKMKVTWGDGNVTEYTYEKKNGKVFINSGELIKISPFKKGERLEGTWEYSNSTSADYGTGYKSSAFYSDSLTLHADGTFKDNSMSSVDSLSNENNLGGYSQDKNSGTYLIYDNTIVLTYPDSSIKRMTISAPYGIDKNYGKPAFLYIDGRMFYIRT